MPLYFIIFKWLIYSECVDSWYCGIWGINCLTCGISPQYWRGIMWI